MSLIIHRCKCGKADIHHEYGYGCNAPTYGPSEVLPTWDGLGNPVETVVEPGTEWRGFGKKPVDLCGYKSCRALYAEQVAA